MFATRYLLAEACLFALFAAPVTQAQITPSGDAYTNTTDPTVNYGAKTLLDVESTQTSYIQFDLSSIPSGYTGTNITQATLKLYVNAVTKAGSFNVDYVNGAWTESTITANTAPPVGSSIATSVPLSIAEKNHYILIDVTSAVQAWINGTETNNGIALVGLSPLNASFDSKENTTTSHPAELDIVFAGITGVATASGSGLTGGGTTGTLNLALTNACATNQVLHWSGSAWVCSNAAMGTITGVTAGTDLTGGGTGGNVTLNLNTAALNLAYAQLAAANTFTGTQTIDNNVSILGTGPGSALSVSGATTGVSGQTLTNGGSGLYGADTSPAGGYAIYGVSTNGTGLYGSATASTGNTIGVYGSSNSPNGVGVYGYSTMPGTPLGGVGVYGTSNAVDGDGVKGVNMGSEGNGVVGLADSQTGYGLFGSGNVAVYAVGSSDEGFGVIAEGSNYGVYSNGNLAVGAGYTKSGVAVLPDDRAVLLYSMESPENWYEDFGSGKLQNGATTINIEPTYAQTVNTTIEYHVFLTPKGDCKGLYVTHETSTTFDVRELGGGQSGVAFDYRIVAKRKGLESLRLEVISNDHEQAATMRQHLASRPLNPPMLKRMRKPPERPAFFAPPKPQPLKPPQAGLVTEPPRVNSPASQQRVAPPESPR